MNKALIAVAALGVTAGAWHWRSSGSDDTATTSKLAFNRLWIDHMPKNERDTVQVLAMFDPDAVGIFQAASMWRGAHELFKFEANGGDLRIVYPQTGDKTKAKVKAKKCNDNGFDYCLELDGAGRGVTKYYSYEGWELDGMTAVGAKVDALTHAAPHAE